MNSSAAPAEAQAAPEDAYVETLLALWSRPFGNESEAEARFRELYADPVWINGVHVSVHNLAQRAGVMHEAFTEHHIEVVSQVFDGHQLALAFRHHARHTGTWVTPLGELTPTGRHVRGLGIDILTIRDDKVHEIWVLADELQRLQQVCELRVERART
jgi:hypothetical protein